MSWPEKLVSYIQVTEHLSARICTAKTFFRKASTFVESWMLVLNGTKNVLSSQEPETGNILYKYRANQRSVWKKII